MLHDSLESSIDRTDHDMISSYPIFILSLPHRYVCMLWHGDMDESCRRGSLGCMYHIPAYRCVFLPKGPFTSTMVV